MKIDENSNITNITGESIAHLIGSIFVVFAIVILILNGTSNFQDLKRVHEELDVLKHNDSITIECLEKMYQLDSMLIVSAQQKK